MPLELYYTSAPKGLKQGTTGFCTVAVTGGMPDPMIHRLESLSGYRTIFRVGSPDEKKNPPEFAHWRVDIGGQRWNVLSHVCYVGADLQGRANKFAHHVAVDPGSLEQVAAGPAWVMMQPGVMAREWTGEPRVLPPTKTIPDGFNGPAVCNTWAKLTGDAGWAGRLVEAFLLDASKPAYIIYKPGTNVLPLINEAMALLPEQERWKVTFSTYFTTLPAGLTCSWRCCAAGTPAATAAATNATSGVLIDLDAVLQKKEKAKPDSKYVLAARSGQVSTEEMGFTPTDEMIAAPVGVSQGWSQIAEPTGLPLGKAAPQPVQEIQAPEPVAVGQATSATRAGLAPAEAHLRRRRRWLFGLLAFIWPIIALGGAWLVLSRGGLSLPGMANSDQSEMVANLEKERDSNKERINTQNETITQQQRQIAKHKGEADKLKREKQSVDKELLVASANATGEKRRANQLDKRVKELEAIVKALKTGQPPVVVATKDPGNGTPNNGGNKPVASGDCIAEAIPGVPGSFFAKLPELLDQWSPKTIAITVPLVNAPGGGLSVKIIPVIKKATGQPFWSTEDAGAVTIHYERTDNVGIEIKHTVGKAKVKEGKLLWQWQELTFGQSSKHRAELQNLYDVTSNSILQVVDGQGKKVTQVQLVPPEEAKISVGQGKKLRPLPKGSKPRLILVGAPGWHLKEDKNGRRIESKNGVRIDLDLLEQKNEVELKTRWGHNSSLGYIDAELGKAKIQIPNLQDDCGKKRAYLTGFQEKSGEKGQEIKELGGKINKFSKQIGIHDLDGKLKQAQAQIRVASQHVNKLKEQVKKHPNNKDLITKLTQAEEKKGALQRKVNGLKAELAKLRNNKKLPGTEKTVYQAEQDLAKLNREQKTLGETVKKANTAVGAADKNLADAKGNKARLEAQKKEIATLTRLQLNLLTQRSDAILGMIVITK